MEYFRLEIKEKEFCMLSNKDIIDYLMAGDFLKNCFKFNSTRKTSITALVEGTTVFIQNWEWAKEMIALSEAFPELMFTLFCPKLNQLFSDTSFKFIFENGELVEGYERYDDSAPWIIMM